MKYLKGGKMRKNILLRGVLIITAIIFVLVLSFAYGNLRRGEKANQKTTKSDQSQQKKTDATDSTLNKNEKPDEAQKKQNQTKGTSEPAKKQPSQQNSNIPVTGGGSGILPTMILSLLFYKYRQTRKLRNLYK